MKSKILIKLASSFAAVMLLFTVVLGIVFLALFRRHTVDINRATMEEKAVSIAGTLSAFEVGSGATGRGGMGGYGAYLRFLDELAMAEVWIVDEQLRVQSRGHGALEPSNEPLPEHAERIVARVFAGELTYGEEFSGLLGTPSLTVGAPIFEGGRVVGAVLLHSPVSGINAAVRQGGVALIAGAGVALLLAGAAAVVISYRFTRPLARMKTAALQLAQGNYTAQTGVLQQDEIGQLAGVLDELARRLRLADAERDALDKLRENFVANVSHELRTPVAVLRGSLENLRDGAVSQPQEVADCYEQMLAESHYLERLVNDLLDLSRLQDEGFHLELGEVNLCDVMRDAARAIRRGARTKGIDVKVACPDEECVVTADYGRIRQLLLILLDNAVKFSAENGTVEVALSDQNGVVLTVTDHGAGIAPEELPYIFDRFHKGSTPANKSGTGLGLAIAKEIAARHHADIRVTSSKFETCFTICFLRIA